MSEYDDDQHVPGQGRPGDAGAPARPTGAPGPGDPAEPTRPVDPSVDDTHTGTAADDTRPIRTGATAYPPPSLTGHTSGPPPAEPVRPAFVPLPAPPQQPGPSGAAFGRLPPPVQPSAFPPPYGYPSPPPAPQPRQGGGRGGLPGWAWPALTGLALVVGTLGGVLGGVAVSSSMRSGDGASPPPISTNNGAAAPLRADNGSVAAVAARLLPSTVQIQANGGAETGDDGEGGATGSGFVLDREGHVVTNNHVVADAADEGQIKVVGKDGRRHAATIVGRSPVYDLAILEVSQPAGLRPAAIGSSQQLRVGDTVVAIGSPLGLSSTVTTGIVSATERPVTTGDNTQSSFINALQTDAAINPGNSGGPLVDLRGQVVGVNSAIATTGGMLSGQSGNIGVGFAIPIEQVRVTAGQILETGEARYPVIGANVKAGPANSGAEIADAPSAGTPAAEAGLRKGDLVTRVDGKPVTDNIGLIVAIRSHQPGEVVDLTVRRDGKATALRVTLDSKVDAP
ncbi:MAG TPA: trypsin-like peptidase domain-containing protein [Nocardioidaceae bacterium]|nr:trypsin-like peptidase domain-containing protein [Nocardioidaceae bacterium]